ncbi:carboxypeptidase regulatory-like domain-containing protein [SAR86 cluster bacterium]|uniref:Carboxypeptidase regulatory-like domain-containing protein n=1 Tax=SAR86 cluster bacterium TaxID=2030880 RepID=A0A9Q8X4H5_9GAMM|nr:carboxypeptidase regulatory-like domain-containing protein [SAR86 cluster bacterium]
MKKILLSFMAIFISLSVYSQETTSDVKGFVSDSSGNSVGGASVSVVYVPTNAEAKASSNSDGYFVVSNLKSGGPYSIVVASAQGTKRYNDVFLSVGAALSLNVVLEATDEVVATASLITRNVAPGPSTVFNLADIEAAPAWDRDIKDVITQDPRIFVDESQSYRGFNCNGSNPRYNALSVDGIGLNDGFGLNSNGYPTSRMPFSYDAIEQVSVEFAPYDVMYGGFAACVVNAVTRSGSDTTSGKFFYEFVDDSLQADSLEGDSLTINPYEETKYGFTLGGKVPEVENLYYFVAFEQYDDFDPYERGYVGSGQANESSWLSEADFNRIRQIAKDVYGFDPGGLSKGSPSEDVKLLAKFDYFISDQHRAEVVLNYNDGFEITPADSWTPVFESHFYERGHELQNFQTKVFSQWTDDFSTEIRIGYRDLANRQLAVSEDPDFGEFRIYNVGGVGSVYLSGTDDSRQANQMSWENTTLSFKGEYLVNNHLFKFGMEQEDQDIFNIFVPHSRGGEYRVYGGIDAFEAGDVRAYYGNSQSLDPKDSAAVWGYGITTLFLQDDVEINDRMSASIGVRHESYQQTSNCENAAYFIAAYGYGNCNTIDGLELTMPRLSVNFDLTDRVSAYVGHGVFTGGYPNVWLSNTVSNDGVKGLQFNARNTNLLTDALCTNPVTGKTGPGYGIPCALLDRVTSGGVGFYSDYLDPNFKIPKNIKTSFGLRGSFDLDLVDGLLIDDIGFYVDYISGRSVNAPYVHTGELINLGSDFAGVPIYDKKPGAGYNNLEYSNQSTEGEYTSLAVGFSKEWAEQDLFLSVGYAEVEALVGNPMNSSVGYSSWTYFNDVDRDNPSLGVSQFEIPERMSAYMRWSPTLFADLESRFSLTWSHNKGRPYSFVFNGYPDMRGDALDGDGDNMLLYVPTGPNDPNVVFADGFDTDAFFATMDSYGFERGAFVDRGQHYSPWYARLNFKFEQMLPGLRTNDQSSVFFTIRNLGNFLNDEWGIYNFQSDHDIVDGQALNDGVDQYYIYRNFRGLRDKGRSGRGSSYLVKIGFSYRF